MDANRMLKQISGFFEERPERQQEYSDFTKRYQDDPEGISNEEAARRYRELMAHTPTDDYLNSPDGLNVLGDLSEQDRQNLAEHYRSASNDPSRPYQGYDATKSLEDSSTPQEIARMTRQAAQEDPDLLEQLVGKDSPLASPKGKLALAGLAVLAARTFLGKKAH